MESADRNSELDVLHERLDTALGNRLEAQWEEILNQWSGASPSSRTVIRSDLLGLRNRLLARLLEVDSLDELQRAVAIQYVEVRCRWMILTLRIRHQTVSDDAPGEQLLCRAACVNLIVQALEPLVEREVLAEFADTLVEPLS